MMPDWFGNTKQQYNNNQAGHSGHLLSGADTMTATAVLLIGLALGQAAEKAAGDEDIAAKVKELVGKQGLGSVELAKRDAAEKALVELGPDVLQHLPTVTPRTAAEDKLRLQRVRNALEGTAIAAATKASSVTLSGEMLFSEAIAKISEQTGNKLTDYRERFNQERADPKINVSLDKAPFWKALDTVLDAAGMTIYNYDEEKGSLAFTSRGDNAVPRLTSGSYSGLFRLEPTKIEATRDLKQSQMHALRLTVDALWEPRMRPIVIEVPLADISAKDDSGNDIGIDKSEGTLEVPVEGNGAAVEIEFPLEAPARSVKSLASLKGKATAVVLGKVEAFEFVDIDKVKSAEQERGGVVVLVENCRKNGDVYDISLRVRYDRAANALQSHRGWIYNNECYLVDAKGRRVENAGLEATLLARNEVGMSYKFNLDRATPANCKFIYKTPAAIIRIPVEFELKNIDLP
jgi:hypothetical protein